MTPGIVVVGAGIVGSSVAYHLARAGLAVTVVEGLGAASGVTGRSFAWIGDNGGGHSGPGAALHDAAPREWHRLEAELSGVRVRWTGSLSWTDGAEPGPRDGGGSGRRLGSAEIAALEPDLRAPPAAAFYSPGDGAIDPVAVTHALLEAARQRGAEFRTGTAVAVRRDGGRVTGVDTSTGFLPARDVVLAAGVGASALCAPFGVDLPVEPSPAVLVRCSAPRDLVRTIVATPHAEVRGTADGGLVAAMSYDGEDDAELGGIGRRLLAWLTATFRGAEGVRVIGVEVGIRPVPADGVPIVGRLPGTPGVHVAVVHPGVQLAPIVGRLVAEEIATGVDAEVLRDWRPARRVPGG